MTLRWDEDIQASLRDPWRRLNEWRDEVKGEEWSGVEWRGEAKVSEERRRGPRSRRERRK